MRRFSQQRGESPFEPRLLAFEQTHAIGETQMTRRDQAPFKDGNRRGEARPFCFVQNHRGSAIRTEG
jgi:hypothetical protein